MECPTLPISVPTMSSQSGLSLPFKRTIFVHPFHEENPVGLANLVGAENVLFGSDYPHPEGMSDPITFVDELDGLPKEDVAKIMGGNLASLMGVTLAA